MLSEIHLRFYEELNDYLPPDRRKREFSFQINERTTVRQMLRALGIPVAEVELVLVNGSSAGLFRKLKEGDRVSIYPVFESLDVRSLLRFRRRPLRRTRFVAQSSLSGLSFYLRFLGFDVLIEDPVRVAAAERKRRILLTSDPALIESGFSRICVVRKTGVREQLKEVLARLDLE
jgi:uncharacterized protein